MNSVENEENPGSKGKDRLRQVSNVVISIITLALVGFVAYTMVCSARGKAVEVFGRCVLRVVTGSMEPSLHTGDYIYVKKADAGSLAEGDIISFYSEEPDVYGKIVTHRIKEKLPDGTFVTQGDANKIADSKPVRYDQIIGKYSGKARFYRWIGSFGDRRKLLLILVIIPLTLMAFYEVRTIAKISFAARKTEPMSDEEKEKLIREAIDREKERLALEGFEPETETEDSLPESETGDSVTEPEEAETEKTDSSGSPEETAGEADNMPEKEVETVESGKTDEGKAG